MLVVDRGGGWGAGWAQKSALAPGPLRGVPRGSGLAGRMLFRALAFLPAVCVTLGKPPPLSEDLPGAVLRRADTGATFMSHRWGGRSWKTGKHKEDNEPPRNDVRWLLRLRGPQVCSEMPWSSTEMSGEAGSVGPELREWARTRGHAVGKVSVGDLSRGTVDDGAGLRV